MPKHSAYSKAIIITAVLSLALSGCSLGGKKQVNPNDGGLFKSDSQGSIWAQKGLVMSVQAKQVSIAGINNYSFVMDPSDHKALYYGSVGNGLFYSYDAGESWQKVRDFGTATVRAVAVAPDSKCRIYAAVGNRLYRSSDCNRTYEQVYYDNDPAATVDAVVIDQYDPSIIYIGISRGDLVKSSDLGDSWQTIHRFRNNVKRIIIDPNDSRRLFAATGKNGAFFSADSGAAWADLNPILRERKLAADVRDIIITQGEESKIFIATVYGLIRSGDQGQTWDQIELIQPEKKATINAVAVNPQNDQEIYYVTNTTFFRSVDGGENWSPAKLPTSRAGWKLLIDPVDPKIVYMGVRSLEK